MGLLSHRGHLASAAQTVEAAGEGATVGTEAHRHKSRQCAPGKHWPTQTANKLLCTAQAPRPGLSHWEVTACGLHSHLTEPSMAIKEQASDTAFCRRASHKSPGGTSRGPASFTYIVRLGWCSIALLLLAECTAAAARPLAAGSQSRRMAEHGGRLSGLQEGDWHCCFAACSARSPMSTAPFTIEHVACVFPRSKQQNLHIA